MRPLRPPRWILWAALTAAVALSGCGGSDGDATSGVGASAPTDTPSALSPQTDKRLPPPEHPAEIDDTQAQINAELEQERETKRLEAQYTSTPFEKAVERLPLHKPPLNVDQVILDGTHRLGAAIELKRFCGHTLPQRQAAIAAFYKKADALMRREKINDFELYVVPIDQSPTAKNRLATGRRGVVRLTAYGRTASLC